MSCLLKGTLMKISNIKFGIQVEDVEESRKLLKLNINIGDEERTVFAGIKKSYSPDYLLGKLVVVIINLKELQLLKNLMLYWLKREVI